MAIPLQISDNKLVEVVLGRVGAVDQDPHSGNRYSVISNRFVNICSTMVQSCSK
jgi:hypothetical protein